MMKGKPVRPTPQMPQVTGAGGTLQHGEYPVTGPYVGASADTFNFFGAPGQGLLARIENGEIFKGGVVPRRGISLVQSQEAIDDVTRSGILGAVAFARLDSENLSQPYGNISFVQGKQIAVLGKWSFGAYTFGGSGVRYGTAPESLTFSFLQGAGNTMAAEAVTFAAGFLSTSAATTNTILHKRYLQGCYVNPNVGNEWGFVESVNGATLQLTANPSDWGAHGPPFDVLYLLPLQTPNDTTQYPTAASYTSPRRFSTAYVPTDSCFYVCGPYGGVKLYPSSSTHDFFQPDTRTDRTQYQARAAAYYSNRILIATDYSATMSDPSLTTGGVPPAGWTTNDHPGRIAFSGLQSVFSFKSTSWFDSALGEVYRLFTMRDSCYGIGPNGIVAYQKTGNSSKPFRQQVLVETKGLFDCEPAVIDGATAILSSAYGPLRFDGSALDSAPPGVTEAWRVNPPHVGRFEGIGRKAYFFSRSYDIPSYVLDVKTNQWSTLKSGNSSTLYDIASYYYASSTDVESELVAVGSDGFSVNSGVNSRDGASTKQTTIETFVVDPGKSGVYRSCDGVRISYMLRNSGFGTAVPTVTVAVFVDGGVTAAVSSTAVTLGSVDGKIAHSDVTFAPVRGNQFTFQVIVSTDTAATAQFVFFQAAPQFVERGSGSNI